MVERHVVRLEVELAQQQLAHLGRHPMVDLEAHGATEAPAAQLHLDRGEQVVGFLLLEGEVGVARDAERHEVDDVHPGEERRRCAAITCSRGTKRSPSGSDHEARQQRRHLHAGEPALAGVGVARP